MRTIETKKGGVSRGWDRFKRDLVFLIHLTRMVAYYWIAGRRIRKAYRECEARGVIYWVDSQPADTQRRLR
jgi:hypothetical protein